VARFVDPVIQNYIAKYLPLPNLPGNGFIASPSNQLMKIKGFFILTTTSALTTHSPLVYLVDDQRQLFPLPSQLSSPLGGANANQFPKSNWHAHLEPYILAFQDQRISIRG